MDDSAVPPVEIPTFTQDEIPLRSLSQQFADHLRTCIENGQLKPGDRLPGDDNLPKMTGLSGGTVRKAVDSLVSVGLLETQAGRGIYVGSAPQRRFDELARTLAARIDAGDFPPGRLPSERSLVNHYGVAVGTVRKALALLTAKGILATIPNLGRYPVEGVQAVATLLAEDKWTVTVFLRNRGRFVSPATTDRLDKVLRDVLRTVREGDVDRIEIVRSESSAGQDGNGNDQEADCVGSGL